jgi:hypothetical protein
MALISKAVFEKQAPGASIGDHLRIDRYVSAGKALSTLADGGSLVLVTVRPGERLWLCALLDAPAFDGTMWRAAPSQVPIVDVTDLVPSLVLANGKGIKAPAGKLGMSLQTPRTLAEEDVALLRGATNGKPAAAAPKIPSGMLRRFGAGRPAPQAKPKKVAKPSAARAGSESWDGAHHLLISALEVTPPELHPARPFHGGGPQPKVDALGYVTAALWLADRGSAHVEPRDRESFDGWVKLARRQLELGPRDVSQRAKLFQARAGSVSRVPLKLAVWAAHEAANWAFRPIYAGGAARPAAGQLARLLLEEGSAANVRAYLADLDALCVHLELLGKVRERGLTPSAEIETTICRGHADGKPSHWLMRLANRRYALLAKVGARWVLTEGKRGDVLARLSADQRDAATRADTRAH